MMKTKETTGTTYSNLVHKFKKLFAIIMILSLFTFMPLAKTYAYTDVASNTAPAEQKILIHIYVGTETTPRHTYLEGFLLGDFINFQWYKYLLMVSQIVGEGQTVTSYNTTDCDSVELGEEGNIPVYIIQAGTNAKPVIDFYLSESKCKVTFNSNGGSAVSGEEVVLGEKATKPANPTKNYYTFDDWYTDSSLTTKFDFANTAITQDTTVYAKWTPVTYTITYANLKDGTNPNTVTTYTYESSTITFTNPTRTGYTGSWNVSSIPAGSNGNKTITAQWTPVNYTISYTLNGGSASNKTSYTIEDTTFTLNNPTRSGYTFKGWTGSNGNTPQTTVSIAKGSTGNKSYTANWYKNVENPTIEIDDSDLVYTTKQIKPEIVVKDGDTVVPSGEYSVSYTNNINVGTATVTISNVDGGNYIIWTKSGNYEIEPQVVELVPGSEQNPYTQVLELPLTYNADHQEAKVKLYDNNGYVISSGEYTVSYSDNRDAGEATVYITDVEGGNYIVNGSEKFPIDQLYTEVEIILDDSGEFVYNGEEHTPAVVKVKAGSSTLEEDEYTVLYRNNTDAGTASVTIESTNPSIVYLGEATFEILPKDIEVTVDDQTKVYGDDDPEFTYTVDDLIGDDTLDGLTISRTSGEDVGEYTITVSHDDTKDTNYNVVVVEGTLEITPQEVEEPEIILSEYSFVYDGKQKEPEVTVKDNNGAVIPSGEYEVEYANNKKVGTATVTITDKEDGNYIVNGTSEFTIESLIIDVEITLSGDSEYEYNGEEIKPEVARVQSGINEIVSGEYDVIYSGDTVSAGTITVTLKSKDNDPNVLFNGSVTYVINPKPVTVFAESGEKTYGEEDPDLTYTVEGLIGEDTLEGVTVTRVSGENVGEYEITVTHDDTKDTNYIVTASGDLVFTINPKSITVTADSGEKTYGEEDPDLTYTVEGLIGEDTLEGVTVTRVSGENAGEYEITVTHDDTKDTNYTVTISGEAVFTINPKSVTVTANSSEKTYGEEDPDLTYTAEGLVGEDTLEGVTITRVSGEDAGEYEITVTHDDTKDTNYAVTISGEAVFTINPKSVTVTANSGEKTYGEEDPDLTYTVEGLVGEDTLEGVTIARTSGEDAGEYEITVTHDDTKDTNYAVTISGEATFTINQKVISSGDVTANTEKEKYAYTGKAIEPKVILKDKDGNVIPESEYEVSYENNINKGTGTIKIANKEGGNLVIPDMEITFEIYRISSGGGSSSGKKEDKEEEKVVEENIWSDASEWAIPELKEAEEKGLIPNSFAKKDFTTPVTRKYFAAVALKLYEAITKTKVDPVTVNPFTDTNDEDVLRAYAVGITLGTSETTFTPNMLITREQMATMLTRGLNKAGINVTVDLENVDKFVDDYEMHDWGRSAIYFMAEKDIIKGIGDNRFNTLGNATFEQSLAIALRCVKTFAK